MRTADIFPFCATYIASSCVIYDGENLSNLQVENLDPLNSVLESIDEAFATITGVGVPTSIPAFFGQLYINGLNADIWIGMGTDSPNWGLLGDVLTTTTTTTVTPTTTSTTSTTTTTTTLAPAQVNINGSIQAIVASGELQIEYRIGNTGPFTPVGSTFNDTSCTGRGSFEVEAGTTLMEFRVFDIIGEEYVHFHYNSLDCASPGTLPLCVLQLTTGGGIPPGATININIFVPVQSGGFITGCA